LKNSASQVVGSILYGTVLFVVVLATLEGFSGLNTDLKILLPSDFHTLMFVLAIGVASYEAKTERGLSGLQQLFAKPEPIDSAPAGEYTYRPSRLADLRHIRKLAMRRYGYAFSQQELERWFHCNPACFFVMFCDGKLVGYIDAFPIATKDYSHLLEGKRREQEMTPLKPHEVDEESSFYIASVVIAEGFGSQILALFTHALKFYSTEYRPPANRWTRLCAIGHSQRGRELLTERGMLLANPGTEKQVFQIDHKTHLSKLNHRYWKKLFPRAQAPAAAPSGGSNEFINQLKARRDKRAIRRGL